MSHVVTVFLILAALAAVSFLGDSASPGRRCVNPWHRTTEFGETGYCRERDGLPLFDPNPSVPE
jgi:hypothetical protein